jgi:orotidine-5'-phosphate decarboxylase
MKSRQKSELCFAVDVTSKAEAQSWVERMKRFPITLKFGLKLLPLLDAEFFRRAKESGQKIFIDAKLHDIPSQVADSVQTWEKLGADYLTIHLSGGSKMIRDAVQAASRTQILGVSVLTSMNAADFQAEGDARSLDSIVTSRARLADSCGVQWIVSAVSEVSKIRAVSSNLKSVTPGLSFDPKSANPDQSRTASVEAALEMGIEMLVVGRSILSAPNPEFVVESILDLIH